MNARRAGVGLLGLTIAVALAPLLEGPIEIPTAQHHLIHAALIGASAASALLLVRPAPQPGARYGWLLLAVFTPFAAMALMWPSAYSWFEAHPGGHVVEHLGIIATAFVAAYAGERYARGIGWACALGLLFMAVSAAWGFGTVRG